MESSHPNVADDSGLISRIIVTESTWCVPHTTVSIGNRDTVTTFGERFTFTPGAYGFFTKAVEDYAGNSPSTSGERARIQQ